MVKSKRKAKLKVKRLFDQQKTVIFAVGFALVGAYILIITNAAGPTASFEVESGTLKSPASFIDESTASGGRAVRFGAASSSSNTIGPREVTVIPTGTVRVADTLNEICSHINASSGGDTVKIESGTYAALNCSAKSASSEIKIMPADNASVNIAGATIALGSRNLSFYNIRWTGPVEISKFGTEAGKGSQNISFKGGRSDLPGHVDNVNNFSIGGGNSDLIFEDMTLTGGDSHFSINATNNSTVTSGIHILNNDSGRVLQDHVIINRASNVHVRRNLIHDVIDTGEHSDGVQTVRVDGLWVERNKFYNSVADRDSFSNRNDQGIMINELPSQDRFNTNIHIYNNLFYNSIGTALAVAGGRDIEIYNNTIYDCGDDGKGRCVVFHPAPGNSVERIYVWNNIFENFTITDSQVSFNMGNTVGAFSNFVNPSAGDYRLKAALNGLASGTGIGGNSLAAPTIDLNGAARGNPPDRGAYEF